MRPRWDALNARARGLRTHLLSRNELERLAQSPDLATLADGLRSAGFPITDADRSSPDALELAVRRRAGAQLSTLSRWTGSRVAAALLYEDADRRNLRAILRGAAENAAAARRLAGTIPTPALPERALEELARQPTPRAVATLLAAWRHPLGAPLLAAVGAGQADLFRLEVLLGRQFAERAVRLARRGPLLEFVRETIDVENVLAALVLAERADEVTSKDAFLTGGRCVGIDAFEEAIAAGTPAAAARLARAFGGSPLAGAVARSGGDGAAAESGLLRAQLAVQRRSARRDPLGPAPLLVYVLGLRAEAADVRHLIWGLALHAPWSLLTADLVTSP